MQAAPLASVVTSPKSTRAASREHFAAKQIAEPVPQPATAFYARSDSEPEPTEGDTPLEKAWFRDRPDIIEGIKRGLADMAAGRVEFFDPFERYEHDLEN